MANFSVENILSPKNKKKFDYCVCLGVLNIFNDFKKPLKNILKFVKKGGLLFIFTHINYYNINVRVQFQKTENRHWYSGINSFSKLALQEFFIKNKKLKNSKLLNIN